jgi:hypothetical protein
MSNRPHVQSSTSHQHYISFQWVSLAVFKLHGHWPFLFDIAQNSHIVMLHLMKNYVALWHGLVRVFLPCECDLKKAGWNTNPNGWFAALDVTSTKCKRSRHLIIMNNRGGAFYFWLFFYFLILFVVCRLWGLVCTLHGVSALRSGTSDGALFPWFSFTEWQGWSWMMDGMPEGGGWR